MATNYTLLCLADNIYKPPSQKWNTIRKENRNQPFSAGKVSVACLTANVKFL